ncbi:MAG: histidine kinase [Bacteroidetes bacterium]|nr:histidine kinase [Bacteroidota bacterium]
MLSPKHTTRWREHEFLLATLLCTIAVVGNLWRLLQHPATALARDYGEDFIREGLPFAYTTNILLPGIAAPILIYIAYVSMNLFILPRLLQREGAAIGSFRLQVTGASNGRIEMSGPGSESLRRFIIGLGQTFLLILVLGTGLGIAYFYRHRPFMPRDIPNTMIMGRGIRIAINLTIIYIIYAIVRETSLKKLEQRPDVNANSILLINQCTALITCYFTLGELLYYFELMDGPTTVWYFGIIPAITLSAITNIYWIFPRNPEARFLNRAVLLKVLVTSLAWCIPFCMATVPDEHSVPPTVMALWLAQITITYPLSRYIFQQQKERIMRIRGLETELGQSKADLLFLRSQINPHFLFNVLNTLYGTALHERANRTAGGIQQLGDMMRFMLHENNLDRIAMSKEIEYVKNYISLQHLRTETSPDIIIETDIDEDFPDCNIAPMLLIPFVENAFKHGISLREPSWIKINLHHEGNSSPSDGSIPYHSIRFEVRNSVHIRQGNDPEKGRSGVGMKNVLHRLKLIYPERHEFFVHQDEKEFFVQLALQL